MRDDEQDPPQEMATFCLPLAEYAVVEHRLVERDRQRLLGAKANGVHELALVIDRRELDAPHADAARCDAEAHALARQVVLLEERAQRIRECLDVTELPAT